MNYVSEALRLIGHRKAKPSHNSVIYAMNEKSKAHGKVHSLRPRSGQAVDFRKELKWGKEIKSRKIMPWPLLLSG